MQLKQLIKAKSVQRAFKVEHSADRYMNAFDCSATVQLHKTPRNNGIGGLVRKKTKNEAMLKELTEQHTNSGSQRAAS